MSYVTTYAPPTLPPGWRWLPGHTGTRASGPYGMTAQHHYSGFAVHGLHAPCSGVVPEGSTWHEVCTNAQTAKERQIRGG